MYLKVQYNNSIKQYTLTNNYNKPYIKVSNSILPLTTNTTQGLCIKINHNNTTYRPLEYNSMSTSATYYTSGINSNGLSSTTALTRSSTSQTIYHTCSSTSSTSYLTRSSTSGTSYLTQLSSLPSILMRYESTSINYSNNQSMIVSGSMAYDVTSYQQAGYNVRTGTEGMWPYEFGYSSTTCSIGAQMLYEYRATTITSRSTFSSSSTYSTAYHTYSLSFAFAPYYNYSYHTIYATRYTAHLQMGLINNYQYCIQKEI